MWNNCTFEGAVLCHVDSVTFFGLDLVVFWFQQRLPIVTVAVIIKPSNIALSLSFRSGLCPHLTVLQDRFLLLAGQTITVTMSLATLISLDRKGNEEIRFYHR